MPAAYSAAARASSRLPRPRSSTSGCSARRRASGAGGLLLLGLAVLGGAAGAEGIGLGHEDAVLERAVDEHGATVAEGVGDRAVVEHGDTAGGGGIVAQDEAQLAEPA